MRIIDIIWLPQIIDKLNWKHGITPEEVEEILFGNPEVRKVQKGHRKGEDLYAALGKSESGRYIIVYFIFKITREALILSARDMDRKERKLYERS